MDRLSDKESPIRSIAALALSKLIGTDNPSEEDEKTILEVLCDTLCFDPSALVTHFLSIKPSLTLEY
jgi:condensin complex subunit 3